MTNQEAAAEQQAETATYVEVTDVAREIMSEELEMIEHLKMIFDDEEDQPAGYPQYLALSEALTGLAIATGVTQADLVWAALEIVRNATLTRGRDIVMQRAAEAAHA